MARGGAGAPGNPKHAQRDTGASEADGSSCLLNTVYKRHGYEGEMEVHVDKQRKGKTLKRLWKWMKRRAVVEPGISHLKHGHRIRNRLKGTQGDQLNAVLAAGMNFRKLLRQVGKTAGGCSTRQKSNFTSFSIRLPFTLDSTEKRLFQDRLDSVNEMALVMLITIFMSLLLASFGGRLDKDEDGNWAHKGDWGGWGGSGGGS